MLLPDAIFNDPRFHRENPDIKPGLFLENKAIGTYHFWGNKDSEQGMFLLLWAYEGKDKKTYVTHRHIRCLESGKLQIVNVVPAGGDSKSQPIYENLSHLVMSNQQILKKPLLFEQIFMPVKVPLPKEIVRHASYHIGWGEIHLKNATQGYIFRKSSTPGYIVLVNKKNKMYYYDYFRLIYSNDKQKTLLEHCFGETAQGTFSNLYEIIEKFNLENPVEFKTDSFDPLAYPNTPKDLHQVFFNLLDNASLLSASRVSKTWNQIANLLIPGIFYQNKDSTQKELMAAIEKAAAAGDTQEIRRFLEIATQYKIKLDFGLSISSVLCEVVKTGNIPCLNLLIEKGANINRADVNGYTPLMRAVEKLDIEAVKTLIFRGARPKAGDYRRVVKWGNETYCTSFTLLKQMEGKAPPKIFKEIQDLLRSSDYIETVEEDFLVIRKMPDYADEYLSLSKQLSPAVFRNYFFNSLVKGDIYRKDHFHKGHKYRWFDLKILNSLVAAFIKLPEILKTDDPWLQWKFGTLHEAEKNYELAKQCYQEARKLFAVPSKNPPADLNDILEMLDKMIARVEEAQALESTSSCALS